MFGNLKVIGRANDYIQPNGRHRVMWLCECQCINKSIVVVSGDHLKCGHTKSCGCLHREIASKTHKKFNKYDLSRDYGIGWTSNSNREFYFDLDDFDRIKNYCWLELKNHYIATRNKEEKFIYLHRLIMGADEDTVDHIKHNTFDNRKEQLRVGSQSNNMMSCKMKKSNTSGCTGVWWSKQHNKWVSEIMVNQKKVTLGMSNNFDEAVKLRAEGEEKYFGKWSYRNSLNGQVPQVQGDSTPIVRITE